MNQYQQILVYRLRVDHILSVETTEIILPVVANHNTLEVHQTVGQSVRSMQNVQAIMRV